MIIIYISQRSDHRRQIISAWRFVLIDLHQRVKLLQTCKSATLNTGQPHVNEEQNPRRTTTRNVAPNQMIEQINVTHQAKRVQKISQPGSTEACRRRLASEKRACTSIKSDEE